MELTYILLKELFINDKLIKKIQDNCKNITINKGDEILSEGNYIQAIPLVIDGRIKVIRHDESGRELLLYYISRGESCALSIAAGLNRQKSAASAIADEDTIMLAISIDLLKNLLYEFPRVNDFVLYLFYKRFNELIFFIDSIAFKNVDFRLTKHLQRIVKATGSSVIKTTHQQLADELGTAREVISRLLKQLEKDGKIKNPRGKIEIISYL